MSKVKSKKSTLAGLIESDEEDQLLGGMPTPDSSAENMVPAKKGRGRPKAAAPAPAPSKVSKTKPVSRRLSGRASGKAKAPVEKKERRTALADKTNLQPASDTEEVEDFEPDEVMEDAELEESVLAAKKPKSKTNTKKAAVTKAKTSKSMAAKKDGKTEASVAPEPPLQAVRKGRPARKEALVEPSLEEIIPETQVVEDEMEVDGDVDEEVEETVVQTARSAAQHSNSRHRQPSVQRRHAGSGSDTERNDPALRRKLGEMTKKFEALNAKYQDLREIGLKEAERNFEKMKKQSDENMKRANELISSLKADVAYQTSLAKDSKAFKRKIESQKTDMTALQTQVAQLKASLAESQAENKTLKAENKIFASENKTLISENKNLTSENKTITTKLAANRTAASSVESVHSKVPGSAVKSNGGIRMVGTAEAAQLAQAAQLKEDIYGDLTGLIIQGVKREAEEDVFNCLQTSRNGTLHFKLEIANDKSAESYDDAQCSYVPQLDPSRDQGLMELLPDYLVDEITFPRHQAAKFYARVVKALTEKPA